MKVLAVFVAVAVADFLWAAYIMATSDRQPITAALTASALLVLGAFTTLAYLNDRWLIVPAALGAFVGTWVQVRRG